MILIIVNESIGQQSENNINIETNYHLLKLFYIMLHFGYEMDCHTDGIGRIGMVAGADTSAYGNIDQRQCRR